MIIISKLESQGIIHRCKIKSEVYLLFSKALYRAIPTIGIVFFRVLLVPYSPSRCLRPIHSRRDADATRTPQMFNVLLINRYFHSRCYADAMRTPQSRDKIVITFWSVPLFSRKGNSLLAVTGISKSARVAALIHYWLGI